MAVQHTLKSSVSLEGVGLHSGSTVHVHLRPAQAGTGIRFVRTDLAPAVSIPAESRFVVDTQLATVLGRDGVVVSTVEHCLAGLVGMGVDNALVELDGPEVPILDGSARLYVEAIREVGLRRQNAGRKVLRVVKPIRVRDGDKSIVLRPGKGLRIQYSISFDGRFPGDQQYYLDLEPSTFADELAPARTFGFLEDVQLLRSVGKARGGSLDNAVVLDQGRVMNPEGLRMPDELVRHKILDVVGDLALLGLPLEGHLIVRKGGHALHDALVKAVLARPDAVRVVDPAVEAPRPDFPPLATPYPLAAVHA